MLIAAGCKLCEQPGADPGGPYHKCHPHSKYKSAAPRQEEGDRGEDDHGQHAVSDEADAPVQIEVPAAAARQHGEDEVEEEGCDGDPAEHDPEVELPREELE